MVRLFRTARKSCCTPNQNDVQEPIIRRNTPPHPSDTSEDDEPIEISTGTIDDPIEISSDSVLSYDDPPSHVVKMGVHVPPTDWPTSPVNVPVVREDQRFRLHDMINCVFSVHKLPCENA